MALWDRVRGRRRRGDRPRDTGLPPSANGASSLHLWWEVDVPDPVAEPVVEVAATLEVLVPPRVPRLYFWALQAGFSEGRRGHGAGHLGLQWDGGDPPLRAVNWGGYRAGAEGGGELDGTASALPSSRANPNTRDYPWQPQRPYRLRILRSPGGPGLWRGEVTDVSSGDGTVVRDLRCAGDRLADPLMWSEVFARCDDPSVSVRWSDLECVTALGRRVPVTAARADYQRWEEGGCDNTSAGVDDVGWLQRTNVARQVPPGARLVPPAG